MSMSAHWSRVDVWVARRRCGGIVQTLRETLPNTKILVLAIFPCRARPVLALPEATVTKSELVGYGVRQLRWSKSSGRAD